MFKSYTKKGCELAHYGGLKMDDRTSWWGHKEGLQRVAGIAFRHWQTGSILTDIVVGGFWQREQGKRKFGNEQTQNMFKNSKEPNWHTLCSLSFTAVDKYLCIWHLVFLCVLATDNKYLSKYFKTRFRKAIDMPKLIDLYT